MHENAHKYFAKHCQFQYTITGRENDLIIKGKFKSKICIDKLACIPLHQNIYTSGIPKPKISDFGKTNPL